MRGTVSDDFHSDLEIPAYRPRRQARGIDPGTKRLLLLASGLGGALVLIVGLWSFGGRHHGPPPLIAADSGPVKVKPADPGGLHVAGVEDPGLAGATPPASMGPAKVGANASANTAGLAGKEVDTLAPPPEAPAPADLRRLQTAQAAPAPALPSAPPQAAKTAPPARAVSSASPAKATPAVVSPLARSIEVQLAALPSEADARAEWARLEKRFPAQFAHRKALISRVVSHDGHVFWRVRAGGFGDAAQAREFCTTLRGKGAACAMADF
jgi:cell division septation protein DedD